MATQADLIKAIGEAFVDDPEHRRSGPAISHLVNRLTRELQAPTSPFRQALVKAVLAAIGPEALANAIIARLDGDIDQAMVENALRNVLREGVDT